MAWGANVVGYFNSYRGVGEAARLSSRILLAAGVPHSRDNIDECGHFRPLSGLTPEASQEATLPGQNPYAVNLFHVNPSQIVALRRTLGPDVWAGRYNIGFWYWELATFPNRWSAAWRLVDEVWVASSFVQQALSAAAPVPVVKMPPAIVPAMPSICDPVRFGINPAKYTFLYAFDLDSGVQRKNPLGMIEAYRRAFAGCSDVQLVLKIGHVERHRRALAQIVESARNLPICVLDQPLTRDEMQSLFHRCDCYVSLHRSEGFGLTLAEAMSAGKPVIATGYSGNLEFMTRENSYLVDYTLVPVGRGAEPYPADAEWAEPSVEHAAHLMRQVYTDRVSAAARGLRAQEEVRKKFSLQAAGQAMSRRLAEISGG